MATAAVLGTGIMGSAMARNLKAAGMEVRAWNRSRERAEPLADGGVEVAQSAAEAARGADFLITMLADGEVVAEVVGREGSPLAALAEGGVWIETSTVGVDDAQRLARLAADNGVAFVDAPVLGTREPAEAGELVVLASGPEEVRERCEPVFEAVGKKTVWVGEAGAGTRLKLVANNWIAGLLGLLAETVALAEALDVDPRSFLSVIEGGPLGLPYAQLKGQMMIDRDYPTSFSAELARKDVGLVLAAAGERGLDMDLTRSVAALFDRALASGHGDRDLAVVYEAARKG